MNIFDLVCEHCILYYLWASVGVVAYYFLCAIHM